LDFKEDDASFDIICQAIEAVPLQSLNLQFVISEA
jgi:hypothetical protein